MLSVARFFRIRKSIQATSGIARFAAKTAAVHRRIPPGREDCSVGRRSVKTPP